MTQFNLEYLTPLLIILFSINGNVSMFSQAFIMQILSVYMIVVSAHVACKAVLHFHFLSTLSPVNLLIHTAFPDEPSTRVRFGLWYFIYDLCIYIATVLAYNERYNSFRLHFSSLSNYSQLSRTHSI